MDRLHPFKGIAVMLLALALIGSWMTGVGAQDAGPVVTITEIEDASFPRVTAHVLVADASGPRAGLDAADFRIFEDGIEMPPADVSAASDTAPGVRVVLGLDLSAKSGTEVAWLIALKASSQAFLDSLTPTAQVAVLAFHDQVSLIQDFTSDRQLLQTAIQNLGIDGKSTAVYEAGFEAANLLNDSPEPRKAVVLVTNSGNNFGPRSLDEVVDKAQESGAAFYVIGYDIADPTGLNTLAADTGGASSIESDLDKMPDMLSDIGRRLTQGGYVLTFQSGLKADDAEHDLAICVDCQGQAAATPGARFTAVSGPVTVYWPYLTEGQTVAGTVDLAVNGTAPGPVAWVTYRVDGQVLARVPASPFTHSWDTSTLEPRGYRLTADVVDVAGNRGRAGVTVKVAEPLHLTVSAPQAEVQTGDQVLITAEAGPLAEVDQVELLIDGEPVDVSRTPTYRFALDSNAYEPGEHIATVRAVDDLGRETTTDVPIRIVAPPPPEPEQPALTLFGRVKLGHDLAMAAVIAAAMAVLALDIVGLIAALRRQNRRRRRNYRLEITNLGNMIRRYALWTQEAAGTLKFQFALNGVSLPECAVAEMDGGRAPASPVSKPKPARRSIRKKAVKTPASVTGANNAIGVVGSTLTAIGAMLPGVGGNMARRAAQPAYQVQDKIGSAQAKAQIQTGQANYLAGLAGVKLPGPAQEQGSGAPGQAQAPPISSAPEPSAPGSDRKRRSRRPGETWVETPDLAPAETLALDLLITPHNRHRTRRYPFKVGSMALGPIDSPVVMEEASVEIPGVSWFRRVLSVLIFVVVAAAAILGAGYLLMQLGVWL